MDRLTTSKTQRRAKRPVPSSGKPKAERNRLSSVATAIRLLKAFSEEEEELGVSFHPDAESLVRSHDLDVVHFSHRQLIAGDAREHDPEEAHRPAVLFPDFGNCALVFHRFGEDFEEVVRLGRKDPAAVLNCLEAGAASVLPPDLPPAELARRLRRVHGRPPLAAGTRHTQCGCKKTAAAIATSGLRRHASR